MSHSTWRPTPWKPFDPPPDWPAGLTAYWRIATAVVHIGHAFCSHPDRFDYTPDNLRAWLQPLREAVNELELGIVRHETRLRAEAYAVLEALLEIYRQGDHLAVQISSLVFTLDPAVDNDADPMLVVLKENGQKNRDKYAHLILDDAKVEFHLLDQLRTALSIWANSLGQCNTVLGNVRDSTLNAQHTQNSTTEDVDDLSDRQRDILVVLFRRNALDPEKRLTTEEIATSVCGCTF